MGLRSKIIIPLALLVAVYSVYIWAIWAPKYLGQEREDYVVHYIMEADLLVKGLSPEMLRGDFDEVYRTLDRVAEEYPLFLEISLARESGKLLYEHRNPVTPTDADLEHIIRNVDLVDGNGKLSFLVDMRPEIATDEERLNQPLELLVGTLLVMVASIAFMFNRWLRLPLVKLSSATTAMVDGDYNAALPLAGTDEIGVLANQFSDMRLAIESNERELHQEIAERQNAEAILARDYELQKVIGSVLRFSMEAISVEEMLEKILDTIIGLSWLAVESKGSIFLTEDGDGGLVLKAHRNMPAVLLARCGKVPLGRCLCGQAAEHRQMIFTSHVDDRHVIRYEGMRPHGHAIIPIVVGSRLLGVMNFYLVDGASEEQAHEKAFGMLADVLAIAIERKKAEILLHEQAQIMAQVRDAVVGVDMQCLIKVWNRGAECLFGYETGEVIGRHVSFLFPRDEDDASHKKMFYSVMAEGQGEKRLHMLRKNGEKFDALLSMSMFKTNDGIATGMIAYVMDNTETVRMQKKLRGLNETLEQQVKDRTREVLNQKFALDQHAIVGITDRAGRIVYANDKFCEISGYGREELLGQDHRILNSGYHPRDFFKEMWRAIGHGEVWHGEIKNRRKDGAFYWVDTTIVPFMNDEGKPYQYVSIRTDITDRKLVMDEQNIRNERLKRQQEALLRLTHEGVFDNRYLTVSLKAITEATAKAIDADRVGLWFFNEDSSLLRCENYYAREVIHFESDECIERDAFPCYFNGFENELTLAADDARTDPRTRDLVESKLACRGISSMLSAPIRLEGKVKGIVCIEHAGPARHWLTEEQQFGMVVADMVALTLEQAGRRDAEARLAESAQQLMIANRELDQALIEAHAATRAKSEFLATMSHEVRTPMNGIMGMLEVLRDSDLDEQNSKYVDIAYGSSRMLLDLLNNVLDFSKIEAGRLQLEVVDFNPSQVIDDIVHLMRPLAVAKNLNLSVVMSPTVPAQIRGDPIRFRQVVTNLVSNAIKFTAEGMVTVKGELMREEDSTTVFRLEIHDTGIGISVEDQAHIFDAFAQADSSITRHYGGSGLGLSICKQLTHFMGGAIGVSSIPDKGSLFWFTLPVEDKGG